MRGTVRRKASARRAKRNRTGMLLITFVVTVLFCVMLVAGIRIRDRILENDQETQQLLRDIAAEEARTKNADEARAYRNSEAFIKEVAREKLGLVLGNELIFREKGN